MKIPKTWKRIEGKQEPEFLYFEAPCSAIRSRHLDIRVPDRRGTSSFGRLPGQSFYHDGTRWMRTFRKRNPDYTHPPVYVTLYALPNHPQNAVLVRFPHGLPFHRVMLPAMNRVAKLWGASFYSKRRRDNRALIEGGDEEVFNSPKFTRYDWDGKQLKEVK